MPGKEEITNCCVCNDGTWEDGNPIVFCDGCDMGAHRRCYGAPLIHEIPEGEWFCEQCKNKARDAKCVLCNKTGGAMKRTTDAQWCHICCALWIPEVFFVDSEALESIDYYQVPKERRSHICEYCKESGTCIGCSEDRCSIKFHVPCGIERNVLLEYKPVHNGKDIIVTYCAKHSGEARKKIGWKMRFMPKEDA